MYMSKQPNRHNKSLWYTHEEVIDLLHRISDVCLKQKISYTSFMVRTYKDAVEVRAIEEYIARRGSSTLKQALKRVLRNAFTSSDFHIVMKTIYETAFEDLLLLINDDNHIVRAVVSWRFEIGK